MAFTEDNISQIPALKLLINLGYDYLSPSEALQLRENRESNVILTDILRERLMHINDIKIGSKKTRFEPANIEKAIQKIQDIPLSEGLVQACNQIYNLLVFGHALEQSIDGDKKVIPFNILIGKILLIIITTYRKNFRYYVQDEKIRTDLILFYLSMVFH